MCDIYGETNRKNRSGLGRSKRGHATVEEVHLGRAFSDSWGSFTKGLVYTLIEFTVPSVFYCLFLCITLGHAIIHRVARTKVLSRSMFRGEA